MPRTTPSPGDTPAGVRRPGRSLGGLLGVVVVLALAVGGVGWWARGLEPAVSEAPTVDALPTPASSPSSPGAVGSRLVVGTVGLDVPLRVMVTDDGVVDPPSSEAAYLLADHGVAPSRADEGTVFVAMHALRRGGGPGNALVDIADQSVLVAGGSFVEVDGVVYEVVSTGTELKTEVAQDAELWDPAVPGRLVLITCMPRATSGRAVENVVVVAELVS